MTTFIVEFPEHVPRKHCEAWLNELLSFAEWKRLRNGEYLVVATRATREHDLAENLRQAAELHRISFREQPSAG
jgi:hypothetical protein